MVDRAASWDDLATWDDVHAVRTVPDDEVDPNTIDPRSPHPEVADIDKRVADLEAELAQLKVRKKQILGSQALILRVPQEILSRIFELGVHECIHLLHTVSLVSRHWRALALATPSLWSYIKLDYHWGYSRSAAFQQKMRLYLARSQACKLLVDLDCRYLDIAQELQSIMTDLQPHLARCFSFRVSVPDWEWMGVVRESASHLGPSLEDLYLRIDPSDSDDSIPCTLLSNPCPRLKSIVLEHTPLTAIHTDLPALRKLHLIRDQRYVSASSPNRIGISFKELLSVVSTTPALEELRLQSAAFLIDGTEAVFEDQPSLTLIPALSSLSFNFLESTNISLLLDSTSLPALRRLSVQMESSNEENLNWLSRITLNAQTRLPSLRYLDLRACSIDGVQLTSFIRALHQLPHITALGLSSPPSGLLGTKIFDLLAGGPAVTGTWLLPKLDALCLQSCRDLSGHELLHVVNARNTSGVKGVQELKYLKLAQCYALDPEILDQIKRLVSVVHVA